MDRHHLGHCHLTDDGSVSRGNDGLNRRVVVLYSLRQFIAQRGRKTRAPVSCIALAHGELLTTDHIGRTEVSKARDACCSGGPSFATV